MGFLRMFFFYGCLLFFPSWSILWYFFSFIKQISACNLKVFFVVGITAVRMNENITFCSFRTPFLATNPISLCPKLIFPHYFWLPFYWPWHKPGRHRFLLNKKITFIVTIVFYLRSWICSNLFKEKMESGAPCWVVLPIILSKRNK